MRKSVHWALLIAGLVGMLGASACLKNRFMACEADPDCASSDPSAKKNEKPFCVNLRCVQCKTSKDCGENETCNRTTATCQSLR